MTLRAVRCVLVVAVSCVYLNRIHPASAQQFTYHPPGRTLEGAGLPDFTTHARGIRFPIDVERRAKRAGSNDLEVIPLKQRRAFANSQCYRLGAYACGDRRRGDQCASVNYEYPWDDDFCELAGRATKTPACPGGRGHQGQDIRPPTCDAGRYRVIATASGTVRRGRDDAGNLSHWVRLALDADGAVHYFMHMTDIPEQFNRSNHVEAGAFLGYVSNIQSVSPPATTTTHLHFEVRRPWPGYGLTPVSPYMSLVRAYEDIVGQTGRMFCVVRGDPRLPVEGSLSGDRCCDLVALNYETPQISQNMIY